MNTTLIEGEKESAIKTTEVDGDGDGTGGAAVSTRHTSRVYGFHNEVPSTLSREDTTQRYLMLIKVAANNLVNNSSITNQVVVSQIDPKLPFQTVIKETYNKGFDYYL